MLKHLADFYLVIKPLGSRQMHLSVSFVSWCTYNTRKHTQVHCKCLIFAIVKYGRDCAAAAAAKSLQSCPTLWDPTDGSPPGSPVPGILQARTLEWVAISFSIAWKWKVVSDSYQPHGLQPTRLLRPWDFPGKSTRVGCHCLLHWRDILTTYFRGE